MQAPTIALQRLAQHGLARQPFHTPEEVVAWLGAAQAQEYLGASWSLGMRMQTATEALIEQAFTEGRMLRTHVMRPTWHFVTPADIRWLLELTAPRVNAANAGMYRQLELDAALFSRSQAIISGALAGGQPRTRAELGAALAQAGIAAEGLRLTYIVQRAELDALICSGPRRGKQFTYMLLDERAPQARSLPRDEALAELTRRYYTSHGPATPQDFARWSGLTLADIRTGLGLLGAKLDHSEVDGQLYYFAASLMPSAEPAGHGWLLPTYDEFLVGYSTFGKLLPRRQGPGGLGWESAIVLDGAVVGSWRRSLKKELVEVEIAPFAPLSAVQHAAVAAAAERYGAFVGLPARLTMAAL